VQLIIFGGLRKLTAKNKKIVSIVTIAVLILAGVISYRIYTNLAANKDRAGRISQGRTVAVEVSRVGRQDIRPFLKFSGSLEPLWSAEISAKLDGRLDQVYVDEGSVVRAGMVIAVLDTNELAAQVVQAEGSLLAAQSGLEQAELDLKRAETLSKQGAVSIQALDTARIKRDLAVAQVRSAEGNMSLLAARLDNANVIAPRDGVVVKRFLQSGYYAKAGAPIVSVADVTSLLAKATVGEAQINEITMGLPVKVMADALGDKQFAGEITRISPAASLPSRTFTAEVTIPNADGVLKAGMFGKVEIPGMVHKNALVVPEGALAMREDQKTVFVLLEENKVQQRVLKLGYIGDGWAEVLDGLKEGEQIVTSGQNKLKDGSTVKVGAQEGGK